MHHTVPNLRAVGAASGTTITAPGRGGILAESISEVSRVATYTVGLDFVRPPAVMQIARS